MENFNQLYTMDVSKFVKKKGRLSYLSWAHAWRLFQEVNPDSNYEVCWEDFTKDETGMMIKTNIYVCDKNKELVTRDMWLPVMDNRNQAIPADKIKVTDINKTIWRCLTKNMAMFGLGLSLYAGEDIPSDFDETAAIKKPADDLAKRYSAMVGKFAELKVPESEFLSMVGKKKGDELAPSDFSELAKLYMNLKAEGVK